MDDALDEDDEHATYNATQVAEYFAAATQAALVLGALRAPYRGRSTPVNAWWGTFDLAVSLFSGEPVDPPSQRLHHAQLGECAADRDRLVARRCADTPTPRSTPSPFPPRRVWSGATLSPPAAHWDANLGEYILDWDDVCRAPDPFRAALDFGLSTIRHASRGVRRDPALAASAEGVTPPVV